MVDPDQQTINTKKNLIEFLKIEKTLHEELMEGFKEEQKELEE